MSHLLRMNNLPILGDISSIALNLINGSFRFGVSVRTVAEEIRRVRKSSCPAGDDKGMVEQRDIECTCDNGFKASFFFADPTSDFIASVEYNSASQLSHRGMENDKSSGHHSGSLQSILPCKLIWPKEHCTMKGIKVSSCDSIMLITYFLFGKTYLLNVHHKVVSISIKKICSHTTLLQSVLKVNPQTTMTVNECHELMLEGVQT
ncbi:hypothetical protein GQX74_005670 [Glossina fuscipes]|nr:hypothetical protein GQX74_005670 [Glossina fuscipes]